MYTKGFTTTNKDSLVEKEKRDINQHKTGAEFLNFNGTTIEWFA